MSDWVLLKKSPVKIGSSYIKFADTLIDDLKCTEEDIKKMSNEIIEILRKDVC